MKLAFGTFRILILLTAVLVLISLAAAQAPRDYDRDPTSSTARKHNVLGRLTAPPAPLVSSHSSGGSQVPTATTCAAMLSVNLPDTDVTSAEMIPADPDSGLPEYCDVMGFTQKTIGFDVRMPTDWNGKMYLEQMLTIR
jgi:hypothetical protein